MILPLDTPGPQRAHVPGMQHVHRDGTYYFVLPSGAWKRITPKRFANRRKHSKGAA